jgi:phenylpyruvate tautomerase PptA (4-oxalocrotonate tautomerase family)
LHIVFNSYKIPVVIKKMDEGDFGQFYFFPYPEIQISEGLRKEVETSTIIHEVMEMISDIYGLNLEESQIRTLEVSLMAVFLQNQWLVDRLRVSQQEPITDLGDWPPSQTLPDAPEAL